MLRQKQKTKTKKNIIFWKNINVWKKSGIFCFINIFLFSSLSPSFFATTEAFSLFGETEKTEKEQRVESAESETLPLIAVLVEETLYRDPKIENIVRRYLTDAQQSIEGVGIVISVPKAGDPKEIYEGLSQLYFLGAEFDAKTKLSGIVLIGDIPLPVAKRGDQSWPTIFPYTDFESPAYLWDQTQKRFIFDKDTEPKAEIWHGIIQSNQEKIEDQKIELIKFFDKNHQIHQGETKFSSKIFHLNSKTQTEDILKINLDKYHLRQNYLEDLVYRRFSKTLYKELKSELKAANAALKLEYDSTETSQNHEYQPDIQTKLSIAALTKNYLEAYHQWYQYLESETETSSAWQNQDLDTTISLITRKDELSAYQLKDLNDLLESSLKELLIKNNIAQTIAVKTETQKTQVSDCTDSKGSTPDKDHPYAQKITNGRKTEGPDGASGCADILESQNLLPALVNRFDSLQWHQEPTDQTIAEQAKSMVTRYLPIDDPRGFSFYDHQLKFHRLDFFNAFDQINEFSTQSEMIQAIELNLRNNIDTINEITKSGNQIVEQNFSTDRQTEWPQEKAIVPQNTSQQKVSGGCDYVHTETKIDPFNRTILWVENCDYSVSKVKGTTENGQKIFENPVQTKFQNQVQRNYEIGEIIPQDALVEIFRNFSASMLFEAYEWLKMDLKTKHQTAFQMAFSPPQNYQKFFADPNFSGYELSHLIFGDPSNGFLAKEGLPFDFEREKDLTDVNFLRAKIAAQNFSFDSRPPVEKFLGADLEGDLFFTPKVKCDFSEANNGSKKTQNNIQSLDNKNNFRNLETENNLRNLETENGFEDLESENKCQPSSEENLDNKNILVIPSEDSEATTVLSSPKKKLRPQEYQLYADTKKILISKDEINPIPIVFELQNNFGVLVQDDSQAEVTLKFSSREAGKLFRVFPQQTVPLQGGKAHFSLIPQTSNFGTKIALRAQLKGNQEIKSPVIPLRISRHKIDLVSSPLTTRVNDPDGVLIKAVLFEGDKISDEFEGKFLYFSAEDGHFNGVRKVQIKNGIAQLRWKPGKKSGKIKISVTDPEQKLPLKSLAVLVEAGPPTQIKFETESWKLIRGGDFVPVKVFLADQYGNPIEFQNHEITWNFKNLRVDSKNIKQTEKGLTEWNHLGKTALKVQAKKSGKTFIEATSSALGKTFRQDFEVIESPTFRLQADQKKITVADPKGVWVEVGVVENQGPPMNASIEASISVEPIAFLSLPKKIEIKDGKARFQVFPKTKSGQYKIKISHKGFRSSTINLEVEPEIPKKIQISSPEKQWNLDKNKAIKTVVQVVDKYGNQVKHFGEKISFSLDEKSNDKVQIPVSDLFLEKGEKTIYLIPKKTGDLNIYAQGNNLIPGVLELKISQTLETLDINQKLNPNSKFIITEGVVFDPKQKNSAPNNLLYSGNIGALVVQNDLKYYSKLAGSLFQKETKKSDSNRSLLQIFYPETIHANFVFGKNNPEFIFSKNDQSEKILAHGKFFFHQPPQIYTEDSDPKVGIIFKPESEKLNIVVRDRTLYLDQEALILFAPQGGIQILKGDTQIRPDQNNLNIWEVYKSQKNIGKIIYRTSEAMAFGEKFPENKINNPSGQISKKNFSGFFVKNIDPHLKFESIYPGNSTQKITADGSKNTPLQAIGFFDAQTDLSRDENFSLEMKKAKLKDRASRGVWSGDWKPAFYFGNGLTIGESVQSGATDQTWVLGDPTLRKNNSHPRRTENNTVDKSLGKRIWTQKKGKIEKIVLSDFNQDGTRDVLALVGAELFGIPQGQSGDFLPSQKIFGFPNGAIDLVSLNGEVTAENLAGSGDIVILDPRGKLIRYKNNAGTYKAKFINFPQSFKTIKKAHLNADTWDDLVAQDDQDQFWTLLGTAQGFEQPQIIGALGDRANQAKDSAQNASAVLSEAASDENPEILLNFLVGDFELGKDQIDDLVLIKQKSGIIRKYTYYSSETSNARTSDSSQDAIYSVSPVQTEVLENPSSQAIYQSLEKKFDPTNPLSIRDFFTQDLDEDGLPDLYERHPGLKNDFSITVEHLIDGTYDRLVSQKLDQKKRPNKTDKCHQEVPQNLALYAPGLITDYDPAENLYAIAEEKTKGKPLIQLPITRIRGGSGAWPQQGKPIVQTDNQTDPFIFLGKDSKDKVLPHRASQFRSYLIPTTTGKFFLAQCQGSYKTHMKAPHWIPNCELVPLGKNPFSPICEAPQTPEALWAKSSSIQIGPKGQQVMIVPQKSSQPKKETPTSHPETKETGTVAGADVFDTWFKEQSDTLRTSGNQAHLAYKDTREVASSESQKGRILDQIYTELGKSPFVEIRKESFSVPILDISPREFEAYRTALESWEKVYRKKAQSRGESDSQIERTIVLMQKNLNTLESYLQIPTYQKNFETDLVKSLNQVQKASEKIGEFEALWREKNTKSMDKVVDRTALNQQKMTLNLLGESFADHHCHNCPTKRGTLHNWITEKLFGALDLPIERPPSTPNLNLNASELNLGIEVTVPEIIFTKTTLPIWDLPDANQPIPPIRLYPTLPKIPPIPDTINIELPTLPLGPEIEIIELQKEIPKTKDEDFFDIAAVPMESKRFEAALDSGALSIPEWYVKPLTEQLSARKEPLGGLDDEARLPKEKTTPLESIDIEVNASRSENQVDFTEAVKQTQGHYEMLIESLSEIIQAHEAPQKPVSNVGEKLSQNHLLTFKAPKPKAKNIIYAALTQTETAPPTLYRQNNTDYPFREVKNNWPKETERPTLPQAGVYIFAPKTNQLQQVIDIPLESSVEPLLEDLNNDGVLELLLVHKNEIYLKALGNSDSKKPQNQTDQETENEIKNVFQKRKQAQFFWKYQNLIHRKEVSNGAIEQKNTAGGTAIRFEAFDETVPYYEWFLSNHPDMIKEFTKPSQERKGQILERYAKIRGAHQNFFGIESSGITVRSVTGNPKLTIQPAFRLPIQNKKTCQDPTKSVPYSKNEALLIGKSNAAKVWFKGPSDQFKPQKYEVITLNKNEIFHFKSGSICVLEGEVLSVDFLETPLVKKIKKGDLLATDFQIKTGKGEKVLLRLSDGTEIEVSQNQQYNLKWVPPEEKSFNFFRLFESEKSLYGFVVGASNSRWTTIRPTFVPQKY